MHLRNSEVVDLEIDFEVTQNFQLYTDMMHRLDMFLVEKVANTIHRM